MLHHSSGESAAPFGGKKSGRSSRAKGRREAAGFHSPIAACAAASFGRVVLKEAAA